MLVSDIPSLGLGGNWDNFMMAKMCFHFATKSSRQSILSTLKFSFKISYDNPLTTKFFPPRQHIFMHSVHTTFVGAPLPQHLLLSGQIWWGSHTWRAPSGNTVNDIHDPQKPSNRRSNVDVSQILAQGFPKLGPDGTPYTINLHVYLRTRLRPSVGSMNLIKIKKLEGALSHSPPTYEGRAAREALQVHRV